MLTVQTIINLTKQGHNKVWKNKGNVSVTGKRTKRWKEGDSGKSVTTIKGFARDSSGSGIRHTIEIDFYGKPGPNAEVLLYCTCDYFLYACDEALNGEGSSELRGSDGSGYHDDGPNPSGTPRACKHLLNVLALYQK